MQQDPYQVLGLSPNAPMEEVTSAYRKLAKKYHPDLNPNDPTADQKMRQINAAYEQIKSGKTGGVYGQRTDGSYGPQPGPRTYRGEDPFGGFEFGGFGSFEELFEQMFGGAWQQQHSQSRPGDSPAIRQVRFCLQSRQYWDAERLLSQIEQKDAQWFYLSALASAGVGNRVSALSHAREAVRLEPNRHEYLHLLSQLQHGSSAYRQAGQQQGYNMNSMGKSLLRIMLAQLFCFCCCRPC